MMNSVKTKINIIFRDFYLNKLSSSILIPKSIRFLLYKLYGMKVETKNICPRCFFGGKNIQIGKGTFINYNCFFDSSGGITIGRNCDIAYEVTLCTSSHNINKYGRRAGDSIFLPININDECWIGAKSIILPGVTIGERTVIAAGSLVISDCDSNSLYAGVPAKKIKKLE